jgi:hypothetical protein
VVEQKIAVVLVIEHKIVVEHAVENKNAIELVEQKNFYCHGG